MFSKRKRLTQLLQQYVSDTLGWMYFFQFFMSKSLFISLYSRFPNNVVHITHFARRINKVMFNGEDQLSGVNYKSSLIRNHIFSVQHGKSSLETES